MEPLLSSEQMRLVDRNTIEEIGIPEVILMEHAALAVVSALQDRFLSILNQTQGVILIGPGKNGADGLVVARLLVQQGCRNIFIVLPQITSLHESQLRILGNLGLQTHKDLPPEILERAQWIVDGFFGTGLSREIEGGFLDLLKQVNQSSTPAWKVAIDIPSGLNSDTGEVLGECFKANQTITFGFLKKGLVTGKAANVTGKIQLAPIQIPRELSFAVDEFWYARKDIKHLPQRRKAAHKGQLGHVHIVLGEEEKEGAALIAAWGALRSGAGLISIAGSKSKLNEARARFPLEIMTEELTENPFQRLPQLNSQHCWVLGPGLGLSRGIIVEKALKSESSLVLDADALSLIAHDKSLAELLRKRNKSVTVLTPHPKEASRLLGCTVADVENNRYQAIKELVKKYDCYCLLKGKGTCVRPPQGPTFVITEGDSGLSKGGSGDLLSGILGSLLVQDISPLHGILLAVYLQGRASELLSQKKGTERASIASEIANELVTAWKELEQ